VECGLLLDVVVGQGAAVLQLLAGKDQALLVRGDACSWGCEGGGGSRTEASALAQHKQIPSTTWHAPVGKDASPTVRA
jgi:hypothetical protein